MVATAAAAVVVVVHLSSGAGASGAAVLRSLQPPLDKREKKETEAHFWKTRFEMQGFFPLCAAVLRFHKLVKSRRVFLNYSEKYFRRFSLRA